MNRRQFLKRGALLGGALAATAASPAMAAHVTESHEPIIGIKLDLYKYPQGTTKVTAAVLITEPETQPPVGVATYPVNVSVMNQIGPGGTVVSTIPAVGWITYGSAVTFDSTTGLPIIFGNIRTEPGVAIGKIARQENKPSEHWNTRLAVDRVDDLRRDKRKRLWDTFVRHANTPPHHPDGTGISFQNGFTESEQDNDYPQNERVLPGEIIAASWQLEGWESKRKFNIEAKFVWGGPA